MQINKEENYMRNEEGEKRINRIRERREKSKNRHERKYKLEVWEKYTYESGSPDKISKILDGFINYT